jgi:23S rRNA pseudouridine1911/1915/1917 synthase
MTPLDPEALEEDAGAPAPDVDLQQPACGHPRAVSIEMVVDPHLGGARADQFLSQRIRRLSRTRAAEIVTRGDVQRPGGRVLRPSTRVVAGETLVLFRVPPDDEPPTLTLHLVHQDEQLLVLDKPPNMPCIPVPATTPPR